MSVAMTDSEPAKGACGRDKQDWVAHLARIGADHGFFDRVGRDHMALFVQEGETLLVSFDSAPRVFAEAADGLPLGFDAVQRRDWSLLSILRRGPGPFQDPDLAAFFQALGASGFFGSFAEVLFVGHGPAEGHAACAYSATAPGASVLATAPLAGFDPELTGFDPSLRPARRQAGGAFDDAPAALHGATAAAILYDPLDAGSGAHAAQFRAPCVTRVPVRFAGATLPAMVHGGDLTVPLLRALANGRLTRARAAELIRPVRRMSAPYLWTLCARLMAMGHFERAAIVASYGADVTGEARFVERARALGVTDIWDLTPAS
jgi:hypothetical protein